MKSSLSNFKDFKNFEKSKDLAEVSVSYLPDIVNQIKIRNAEDAFEILYPLFNRETIELKEEFYILLMNRANFYLGWFKLSSGGTSGTVVDIKMIYMLALLTNASAVILCHNHPSQNLQPSANDIKITNQVREAGKIFDIAVHDHLIVGSDGRYLALTSVGIL